MRGPTEPPGCRFPKAPVACTSGTFPPQRGSFPCEGEGPCCWCSGQNAGGRGRGPERERVSGFCSHHLPLGPLGRCFLGGQMPAEETDWSTSLPLQAEDRNGASPSSAVQISGAHARAKGTVLWLAGD